MSRAVVVAIALAWSLRVAGAVEPPPLVVYFAPPDAPRAAREAVSAVALDSGAGFVDLSPAAPPAPQAGALVARAIQLYDSLHAEEALAALDQALAEARTTGAAALEPRELSDLFLYRGLARIQRGDAQGGWEEMVRCVTVDPARVLDPARFPPRVVQSFQRAAAEVRAAPAGRLAVAAPPACRVFVDARDVGGVVPELAWGEHYVRVACPGEPAVGAMVLLARPRQEVTLPRAPGVAPEEAALVALAAERGAQKVLIATVGVSASGPPTLRLRLREVPRGALVVESQVALDEAGGPQARAAAERLITRAVAEGEPLVKAPPAAPPSWYERPWFWAGVGAAVTAAVLIPIAISSSGSAQSFTVRPGGGLWP